jgi:copper oxidase (laccase) domain-containing protein
MAKHGARPERVAAAIGPAIAQASYEVGPEFPAPFLAEAPGNADFLVPSSRNGHFLFDLGGYLERKLRGLGLGAVSRAPHDTAADEARFFSWRRTWLRGEKDYGRALSAIALVP